MSKNKSTPYPKLFYGNQILKRKLTFQQVNKTNHVAKPSIRSFDKTLRPKKWYAATYSPDDILHVANQGWWNKDIAMQWWRHKLQLNNLKDRIFFIKGEELLNTPHEFGPIYYWNHNRRRLKSKMILSREIRYSHTRKSFKQLVKSTAGCDGYTKKGEVKFFTTMFLMLPPVNNRINESTEVFRKIQYEINQRKNKKQ